MRFVRNQFLGRTSNPLAILSMYREVLLGCEIAPRGQRVRNVRNLAIELDSNYPVLTTFSARNMHLPYARREWLWYIGADKFDDSITKHATMWQKLKQPDGSFYSNYGQYIFGQKQFGYVVEALVRDPDSRRASMVLLNREHLFHENTDMVCTYAINFCIESDRLHMSIMMRSNDVIFGFTNDAFCFWQLHVFMHTVLQRHYTNLKLGTYTHIANSMHVYERHFRMIEQMVDDGLNGYIATEVPTPTYDEVMALIDSQGKGGSGDYCTWLRQDD